MGRGLAVRLEGEAFKGSARRRCPLNWNGKQLPAVVILPGTGDLWREEIAAEIFNCE